MTIRAVVFDLDDTLFDDRSCTMRGLAGLAGAHPTFGQLERSQQLEGYRTALRELEPDFLAGRLSLTQYRHRRFEQMLGLVAGGGEAAFLTYREAYQQARQALPGAVEALTALRAAGLAVGVLTNFSRPEQIAKLEVCGLLPLVDALVTLSDAPPKPDPASYRAICAALGTPPSETLMVGDSWMNDVAGAVAAGLQAVWYNPEGLAAPANIPHTTIAGFLPLEPLLAAVRTG